jgi:hypothetical protein
MAHPNFPLMEAILDAGAPYTSGPQWLAEHVLAGRHVLAIAGTHGKTTTTAMLTWILEFAGLQPGFLVGGVPMNFGMSARLGGREAMGAWQSGRTAQNPFPLFVIEADEYDTAFFDKRSKFVHYRPRTPCSTTWSSITPTSLTIWPPLSASSTTCAHRARHRAHPSSTGWKKAWPGAACRLLERGAQFWRGGKRLHGTGRAPSIRCAVSGPAVARWNGHSPACTTSSTRWRPLQRPSTWG